MLPACALGDDSPEDVPVVDDLAKKPDASSTDDTVMADDTVVTTDTVVPTFDLPSATDVIIPQDRTVPMDTAVCPTATTLCGAVCTLTGSDPANCGSCGRMCASGEVCMSGTCTRTCSAPSTQCATACVDTQTDPAHCGACNQLCSVGVHATPACGGGRCGIVCETNFRDCDGNPGTGCEVSIVGDIANCGACGRACTAANATSVCAASVCSIAACSAGFGNCNAVSTDGCETSLTASTTHCGMCGRACTASQICQGGMCITPVVEDFETGTWPWTPWLRGGGAGTAESAISASCAHDGARGLAGPVSIPRWYYRTDRVVGTPGQRLSAWVRANSTSARVYLGFGATAAGAWSFTFAPNTQQVVFYSNTSWAFGQVAFAPATLAVSTWYRIEVTFVAGTMVTGRIYNSAGTAIVTLNATLPGLIPGGIALDGFASCTDTIQVF
jgi:Stigma-specific protein, Stig1